MNDSLPANTVEIRKRRPKPWMAGVGLVLAVIVIALVRHGRGRAVAAEAAPNMPRAAVVRVAREDLFKALTIPAEFRPYEEVELHAKVSGFVKQMNVDFGDQVKAGQVLAVLEVPELQAELQSAQASWQKSEADFTNADLIYSRLVAVNREHPNLVAQQELDTASASAQTTAASSAAAKADMVKYQTLVDYTKITAPFDGVVTHRYADPGALIQAGTASDTQAMPLVRVSDNYLLRLDFPVTVDYVKEIHLGDAVAVHVDSLNGRVITGRISRFTQEVDDNTRTMITEIEVPNPNLELVPGMYATVDLKVEEHPNALAIPIQAVASDKAPTVLVLDKDDQIEERPVQLGLRTPDEYEVLSGLTEGDMVIVGSRTLFQAGEKVDPQLTQLSMAGEN